MTADTIIDSVINTSGTDASRATVLGLLNETYLAQVTRSRWLLETVTVGTTAVGTTDYSLSDTVTDIVGLRVGSTVYDGVSTEQFWELSAGTGRLVDSDGVYALTYSSSGGTSVSLFPTPTTAGDAITVLAPATATALTDSGASTPVTPTDTHGSLIDGTTALVLLRIDERPDLAAGFFGRFEESIERLRRRKNSRSGVGVQALVQGIHW